MVVRSHSRRNRDRNAGGNRSRRNRDRNDGGNRSRRSRSRSLSRFRTGWLQVLVGLQV